MKYTINIISKQRGYGREFLTFLQCFNSNESSACVNNADAECGRNSRHSNYSNRNVSHRPDPEHRAAFGVRIFANDLGGIPHDFRGTRLDYLRRVFKLRRDRLGVVAQSACSSRVKRMLSASSANSRPSAVARIKGPCKVKIASRAACAASSSGGCKRSSIFRRAAYAALSSITPNPKTVPQAIGISSPLRQRGNPRCRGQLWEGVRVEMTDEIAGSAGRAATAD